MVMERMMARLFYGPIVEDGSFENHFDDYKNFVGELDDVNVGVYEWYDPAPDTRSLLTSSSMNSGVAEEENLDGEEAWNFANNTLEDLTPNYISMRDIPFYFEHRSRSDTHNIRMGASGRSSLGSRRDYVVNFNGIE